MRFLIVSHTPHFIEQKEIYAYAPYVREMNIWSKYVDDIEVVAPQKNSRKRIDSAYEHKQIELTRIPAIDITSFANTLRALVLLPVIFLKIVFAMRRADHIHLRCPGNIGLIGCFAQMFFPRKRKTAKYAGNWDPNSKQPWSYRLQKWILANEFLTKNMQVLVYGDWQSATKNIKPFFTATYTEEDKQEVPIRKYDLPLRFVFVGSLVSGKRPLYVLELIDELIKKGFPSEIHFYGDGPEREKLENYILDHNLKNIAYLHGNQNMDEVRKSYSKSHFLILPSKSEGWPKVVAEAMWWGVIPIVTKVSCVPWMLDFGKRGVLIDAHLDDDIETIQHVLKDKSALKSKSQDAVEWSREYTLDKFESEIKKLF